VQEEPVTVERGQSQLFLDDELVAEKRNVTETWHRPVKHPANPLIRASGPEMAVFMFGSVLQGEGAEGTAFRMWYYASGRDGTSPWVSYARSADGLRWHKPEVGLIAIGGDVSNNAVFRPDEWRLIGFSGVMRDPRPDVPDAERYKLAAEAQNLEDERKYYVTAVSPDGICWTFLDSFIPTPPAYPDRSCLVWDPFARRYNLYCRAKHAPPEVVERGGPAYFGRAVALCTSADFRTWSDLGLVMHAEADDPGGTEIYGIGAFPYAGQWLGLPQIHCSLPEVGMIDVAIAHSRDGVTWVREKEIILPCGGIGEWDRFNQVTATAPVEVGDELWLYYCGRTYRHKEYRQAGYTGTGPSAPMIGLATLRRDGWCSLGASFDGGEVTTRTVVLPDGELYLNAKADWGEVVVEALDTDGIHLNGMRSVPVNDDGVRLPVRWPDGASFRSIAGKPIRLHFHLRNALLYSWQVA